MNREAARRPDSDSADVLYGERFIECPGFYSIANGADGVIIRATSEFDPAWAEQILPGVCVTVIPVKVSIKELETRLVTAVGFVTRHLFPGVAIANTYMSPVEDSATIFISGANGFQIKTLNSVAADPHITCLDIDELPRRY